MSRLGENLLKAPIGSGRVRAVTRVRVEKEDLERSALQSLAHSCCDLHPFGQLSIGKALGV